jgi:hypothetical protein
MTVAQQAKVKAAIALRVTVGHAKGRRAATGRTSHARIKVSVKDRRAATGRTNHAKIKVSVKDHRAATGRISPGRIKVSAKGRRAATGRINRGRIKVSAPIARKVIVGRGHRVTRNSNLVHRVAKVSAQRHHRAMRALMTNIRYHKHHRLGVRQAIKTPCAVGADG